MKCLNLNEVILQLVSFPSWIGIGKGEGKVNNLRNQPSGYYYGMLSYLLKSVVIISYNFQNWVNQVKKTIEIAKFTVARCQ